MNSPTRNGRTVIFGGGGFVGLNVAEALLAHGGAVELVDVKPPPKVALDSLSRLPGTLRSSEGDVRDPERLAALLSEDVDSVVFGAAITAGADRDAREPERILDVNLLGFVRVLRAARDQGIRRVINISSAAAYGDAAWRATDPLDEEISPDPVGLYALTKFGTERVARRLSELWRLDVRSVRLSAVFGPWERQTGDRDTPSALFQIMRAACSGEPAILSRPGDRDWVFGTDVGAAIVALLDAEQPRYDLYNISPGEAFSALAWGQSLAQHRPGFVCRLAEPGETATIDLFGGRDRVPLAIDRLVNDLGCQPQFDLMRSVQHYDAWVRGNAGYDPQAA
ncbi:MAG: NAD(P)-dependent oxidoreductase [Pseudomonadota bacterium]